MKNNKKNLLLLNEQDVSSFVQITGHYNNYTLMDRNSNLIQTIEISGFDHSLVVDSNFDLRTMIRDKLAQYLPAQGYIAYIHIIRDRSNIMPDTKEPFGFAEKLGSTWCKKNNWDKHYVNSMYLTIVSQAVDTPFFPFQYVFRTTLESKVNRMFDQMHQKLDYISSKLCEALSDFGARRLGIEINNNQCISELLSFYHKLLHMREKKIEIALRNAAEQLTCDLKIGYDFNTLCIDTNNEKRYAAIYTLKESPKIPTRYLDKLLQIGSQFIITECIKKISASDVRKRFAPQYEIAKATKDTGVIGSTHLEDIFDDATAMRNNVHCMYQSTIAIYSDDLHFFIRKVDNAYAIFQDLGLYIIREDFNMPRTFWSTIPGNLCHITRFQYGTIYDACAFTSIQHYNRGARNGSKWGVPPALFRNIDGNPFYFNFHNGECGNTLIVGPKGSGKTTMSRFLLTQGFKLDPRIVHIDIDGGGKKLLSELGSMDIEMDDNSVPYIQTVPFFLKELRHRRDFMEYWLKYAFSTKKGQFHINYDRLVEKLLNSMEEFGEDAYTYEQFLNVINEELDALATSDPSMSGINHIFNEPFMENFFGSNIHDLLSMEKVVNIDLSGMQNDVLRDLYLYLLMAKLPDILTGEATIIILSDASNLCASEYFSPILQELLKLITKKNAILIFPIDTSESIYNNAHFREAIPEFSTQIFLSNKGADKYFKKGYNLDEWELYKIKSYDAHKRMFLLKQGYFRIISNINLQDHKEILDVLSAKSN